MSLLSRILQRFRPKKVTPPEPEQVVEKVTKQTGVKSLVSKILERFKKPAEPKQPKTEAKKVETPKPEKPKKEETKKKVEDIRKDFYQREQKPYDETGTVTPPNKSDIILQELESRLSKWEGELNDDVCKARCSKLRTMLQQEIANYGRARVAYSCEQAGAIVISNAAVYVFDSDDNNRAVALTTFAMIIRGEVLSEQDAKDIGEELDNQSFNNEDDLGFY